MATKASTKVKSTKKTVKKTAVKKPVASNVASSVSVDQKATKKNAPAKQSSPAILGLLTLLIVAAGATVYVINKGTEDKTTIVETTILKQSKKNIVDTITSTSGLSTTQKLLAASGLSDAWKNETTPFTLFVGTNEVWDAMLKEQNLTMEDLLKPESKDLLVTIFNGSKIGGVVKSTSLTNGQVVTYADGSTDTVSKENNTVVLIDGEDNSRATITKADVEATNGIIHIIGTYTPAQ